MELSTDKILDKAAELAISRLPDQGRVLDIGSGTGALLARIKAARPAVETYACDYTRELMQLQGQVVDVVDLSRDALPYPDGTFSAVTCTEVIEHLENYRALVREVQRVLKPGGVAVFSTPNILNIQSRLRFLWFGFWNLFGPLPVGRSENYSTAGHITPVSFFYLAHALEECGLRVVRFEVDKFQRSGAFKLLFLWPLIALFGGWSLRRERSRYGTVTAGNTPLLAQMNSIRMLLGRTIVVGAQKEDAANG